MKNWLIIGATSGIAVPLCRELAARGFSLYLADLPETEKRRKRLCEDLRIRYRSEVLTGSFDALNMDQHEAFVDQVEITLGQIDGVVYLCGLMEDQHVLQSDFNKARRQHDINYVAAVGVLGKIAEKMETNGHGHIVAIGSPAGDRGRKSNYLYGADKAALHVFLQGLRHRLAPLGITVLIVKPGPTDTAMTAGMDNLPLLAQPAMQAAAIADAIDRKKSVLYTPWPWKWIMLVIRHLPDFVYNRLNL